MCFSPQLNPLKTPLNPINVIRNPVKALDPRSFLSSKSPVDQIRNPLGTAKDTLPSKKTLLGG